MSSSSFPPSSRRDRSSTDALARLVDEVHGALKGPVRQAAVALVVAATLGAGLVGRIGTPTSRAIAAGLLSAVLVTAIGGGAVLFRRRRGTRAALAALEPADPEGTAAAVRALDLAESTKAGENRGSPELARVFLTRKLGAISKARVREHTDARRRVFLAATAGLLVVSLVTIAFGRLRVVEGLDVLAARDGLAPLRITYLSDVRVEIAPPEYLHKKPEHVLGFAEIEAHHGSVLTVRGSVEHKGRTLVLTDGKLEIPLVDDGRDGVVGHWPLAGSAAVRIAARFSEVRIEQSEALDVRSIPDLSPKVVVKDAPRTVKLVELDEITLEYEATDDHGLREVDLVVRTAESESRRVLSKLDSEITKDKGAATLRAGEKVLDGAFLPVLVTIEGRDNDVLTGPKWGKSEAVTLLPVPVAELEAKRKKALDAARDRLVDVLAQRMEAGPKEDKAGLSAALDALVAASTARHGTLAPSDKLAAFVAGQVRKVRAKERAGGKALTEALERAIVAVDRAAGSLATKDARASAKKVSRMAAYVGDNLKEARTGKDKDGEGRAKMAIDLLVATGPAMRSLAFLGDDLGSIVEGDVRRIQRALGKKDLAAAEWAARDLSARLATPVPSFMGGSGGGGGDASGKSESAGDDAGREDEDAFDAEESALDDLVKDHGQNLEALEKALREGNEELREELSKRADKLRRLAEKLRGSKPLEGAADGVDKMAEALEKGELREAVKEGAKAESALKDKQKQKTEGDAKDAEQLLEQLEREVTRGAAKDGEDKLAPELRWAEKAAAEAERRAKDALSRGKVEERERRARERADELGKQRGEDQGKGDLRRAAEAMKRAEDALKKGEGAPASEAAREAQRALEQAKRSEGAKKEGDEGQDAKEGAKEGEKGSPTGQVAIPKDHAGPEEFRKRVVDGMGKPASSRVKDAVKRYTERLLQ